MPSHGDVSERLEENTFDQQLTTIAEHYEKVLNNLPDLHFQHNTKAPVPLKSKIITNDASEFNERFNHICKKIEVSLSEVIADVVTASTKKQEKGREYGTSNASLSDVIMDVVNASTKREEKEKETIRDYRVGKKKKSSPLYPAPTKKIYFIFTSFILI